MTNFRGGTLGERIYRLRQHLGTARKPVPLMAFAARLTAEAAAQGRDARYNHATLQRWETDQGEPDRETLRVMARLAGVPVYEFAFGEPEPLAPAPSAMEQAIQAGATPDYGQPADAFLRERDAAAKQTPPKAKRRQQGR